MLTIFYKYIILTKYNEHFTFNYVFVGSQELNIEIIISLLKILLKF